MDVLPNDVKSLAGLFHDWCMGRPVPGRFTSNDLFTLRTEEYSVMLNAKPATGNIPHNIAAYVYASDKKPAGPELSLWFDDYTTKRVSTAVWASILHSFCPDFHLKLTGESWLREVVYPDGSINKGKLFSGRIRQCIRMYLAQKQAKRVLPLTFADMEGVL